MKISNILFSIGVGLSITLTSSVEAQGGVSSPEFVGFALLRQGWKSDKQSKVARGLSSEKSGKKSKSGYYSKGESKSDKKSKSGSKSESKSDKKSKSGTVVPITPAPIPPTTAPIQPTRAPTNPPTNGVPV